MTGKKSYWKYEWAFYERQSASIGKADWNGCLGACSLLQLTCFPLLPCLQQLYLALVGCRLEAAVTAESERGMKGLTLCSRDAQETRQCACLWEVTPYAYGSLQEQANCLAQRRRASNPIPNAKTLSKKGIWNTSCSRTIPLCAWVIIILTLSHKKIWLWPNSSLWKRQTVSATQEQ